MCFRFRIPISLFVVVDLLGIHPACIIMEIIEGGSVL